MVFVISPFNIGLEKRKEIVKFYRQTKKGSRTLSSLQKRYTKLTSIQQILRWEKTIAKGIVLFNLFCIPKIAQVSIHIFLGGSNNEKMQRINTFVHEQFLAARHQRAVVHQHDIRRANCALDHRRTNMSV